MVEQDEKERNLDEYAEHFEPPKSLRAQPIDRAHFFSSAVSSSFVGSGYGTLVMGIVLALGGFFLRKDPDAGLLVATMIAIPYFLASFVIAVFVTLSYGFLFHFASVFLKSRLLSAYMIGAAAPGVLLIVLFGITRQYQLMVLLGLPALIHGLIIGYLFFNKVFRRLK